MDVVILVYLEVCVMLVKLLFQNEKFFFNYCFLTVLLFLPKILRPNSYLQMKNYRTTLAKTKLKNKFDKCNQKELDLMQKSTEAANFFSSMN